MRFCYQHLRSNWAEWSPDDQQLWEDAIEPGLTALSEVGPLSHLSERSIVVYAYETTLANQWALAQRGVTSVDSHAAIWIPDRVADYVRFKAARGEARSTIELGVTALSRVMAAVAPKLNRDYFRDVINNLPRTRPKKRSKSLPPTNALLSSGVALMGQARVCPAMAYTDLIAFRNGLKIAVLALRPYRLDFFTKIEIWANDPPIGYAHPYLTSIEGRWWIKYTGPRNGRKDPPTDLDLPEELVPWLEAYLAHTGPRAQLCERVGYDGPALWVSTRGGALKSNGVYKRVVRETGKWLDAPVNPHRFREAFATSLACGMPEAELAAHAVLGNSPEVTARYYQRELAIREASVIVSSIMNNLVNDQLDD